ncbi:MAG: DHH family phosphoesterase [Clostridia bacterium]|nr:DHH family phosphoesterase [Clostridia bacterium]
MERYKKLSVADAAERIINARDALILVHANPDGDAVGSALALKREFALLGKRAKIASPTDYADNLRFMTDGEDMVYREGEEKEYGAVISVDVASPVQLGALERLADSTDLMIDHHAEGTVFADALVDPRASATGEIIFDICLEISKRTGVAPDAGVARFVFAAISADTGSFKFSNTTDKTFTTAAAVSRILSEANDGGLETWDISKFLHDTVTMKEMKINSVAVEKTRFYEDGSFGFCFISADDMKEMGVEDRDMGCAVDVVRSLEGVDVAVVLREKPDTGGSYKISARSNVDVNVSEVCRKFGGGGHVRAAGAAFKAESGEEAARLVREAFDEAVKAYKLRPEINK